MRAGACADVIAETFDLSDELRPPSDLAGAQGWWGGTRGTLRDGTHVGDPGAPSYADVYALTPDSMYLCVFPFVRVFLVLVSVSALAV